MCVYKGFINPYMLCELSTGRDSAQQNGIYQTETESKAGCN